MAVSEAARARKWWKEAVVFQVYPASFQDSNGDGWGDVPGITSRLDYLKELGVDVVWVSPIYKSPQVDMGYDISDYKSIDPRYGTMDDVENLIKELKKRNMKLMMDFVANHTSDQHKWFIESSSSKDNPKRDWYIWKPAKKGPNGERLPPNNWCKQLGEANSAWDWDEETQEYYLALFTPEQPDLNWENDDVRAAIHDVLDFWLQRGCAGFRMDVINHISKDQRFPDAPIEVPSEPYQPGHKWFANGPRQHEFLKEIHDKVLCKYDTITVGEMPFVKDEKEILKVVHPDERELNMIFIFTNISIDDIPGKYRMTLRDWELSEYKQNVTREQNFMIENGGWNSIFTNNHDNGRAVTRFSSDSPEQRAHGAKILALMQATLSGTPYVYQGEEIGMCNFSESWPISEFKDIETINFWKKTMDLYPNDKQKQREALHVMHIKSRDHARTPVHWSAEPNAGFSSPNATPWMRVNDNYKEINVASQLQQKPFTPDQATQESEEESTPLRFWQRLLAFRKEHKDVIVYGNYYEYDHANNEVFTFVRLPVARSTRQDGSTYEENGLVVVLNFTGNSVEYTVPEEVNLRKWILTTYEISSKNLPPVEGKKIKLRPWEGVLGQLIGGRDSDRS